jgi:hypothetical protein
MATGDIAAPDEWLTRGVRVRKEPVLFKADGEEAAQLQPTFSERRKLALGTSHWNDNSRVERRVKIHDDGVEGLAPDIPRPRAGDQQILASAY